MLTQSELINLIRTEETILHVSVDNTIKYTENNKPELAKSWEKVGEIASARLSAFVLCLNGYKSETNQEEENGNKV